MIVTRRTAELTISASGAPKALLALDVERPYDFTLRVDQRDVGGGKFQSPIGDSKWTDLFHNLRTATSSPDKSMKGQHRSSEEAVDAGSQLFRTLTNMSPDLRAFLADDNTPRRLVIVSRRPEIHALPWETLADEKLRLFAGPEHNLSIVRATHPFDMVPLPLKAPLYVCGLFGPNVEGCTRAALEELEARAKKLGSQRLLVKCLDHGATTRDPERRPHLLSVEAHGDLITGQVDAGEVPRETTPFELQLHDIPLVLLWSCHSTHVHSWGQSPAMVLHENNCRFVLGFATELSYGTSKELAHGFYETIFEPQRATDPETTVLKLRSALLEKRRNSCEWASMTLWMRGPVDLGMAMLEYPRLLAMKGRPARAEKRPSILSMAFKQAKPGRPVLVRGLPRSYSPAVDEFAAIPGAVIHLPCGKETSHGQALQTLGAETPRSPHRADWLLTTIAALTRVPGSLLLWTDAGDNELLALDLVKPLHASVCVVATHAGRPKNQPAIQVIATGISGPLKLSGPHVTDPVDALEEDLEAGRYRLAYGKSKEMLAALESSDPRRGRVLAALYGSAVRLGGKKEKREALDAAKKLKQVDHFEGTMLLANWAIREGQYREARRLFNNLRFRAANDDQRGRVDLELGWVEYETRDRMEAERVFRQALTLLEKHAGPPNDGAWASALGRATRDLADTLASDPARADEARSLILRSLAIHALDGRLAQVAAALRTLGKIEYRAGRHDPGDSALARAAEMLDKSGNLEGWVTAILDMAESAFERGQLEQCIKLAGCALKRVTSGERLHRMVFSRLALLQGKAYWRSGRIEEAKNALRLALDCSPLEPSRVRDMAQDLLDFLGTLERPTE